MGRAATDAARMAVGRPSGHYIGKDRRTNKRSIPATITSAVLAPLYLPTQAAMYMGQKLQGTIGGASPNDAALRVVMNK